MSIDMDSVQSAMGVGSMENQLYKCDECGKRYSTARDLISHKGVHTGECAYVCEYCHKGYKTKMNLMNHINLHIGEGQSCQKCNKVFSSSFLLKQHARWHVNEKKFECDVCGKAFKIVESLRNHRKRDHGEKLYSCPLCPRKMLSKKSLAIHLKQHSVRKVPCPYCGIMYKSASALKTHLVKHEGTPENMLSCTHCGERFLHKRRLAHHCKRYHATNNKCVYCDKELGSPEALNSHIHQHLGKKPAPCQFCGGPLLHPHKHGNWSVYSVKCPLCTAVFYLPKHLMEHTHQHGDNPAKMRWSCSTCGCYYLCRNEYERHVAKPHAPVKGGVKSRCRFESCSKSFGNAEDLREHVKFHVGEEKSDKPIWELLCRDCGRVCATINGLLRHQHWHNASKLLPCIYCPEVFPNTFSLRHHIKRHKSHLGNFHCFLCDVRMNRKDSYIAHLKGHYMDGDRVCMKCLVAFPTDELFTSHKEMHNTLPRCGVCSQQVESPEMLKRHLDEKHSNLTLFLCRRCNLGLPDKQEWKKHEAGHTQEDAVNADKVKAVSLYRKKLAQDLVQNDGKLKTYCTCKICKPEPTSEDQIASLPLTESTTNSLQILLKTAQVKKVKLLLPPQKTLNSTTFQGHECQKTLMAAPMQVIARILPIMQPPHPNGISTFVVPQAATFITHPVVINMAFLPQSKVQHSNAKVPTTLSNSKSLTLPKQYSPSPVLSFDIASLNLFAKLLRRILDSNAFKELKLANTDDVHEFLQLGLSVSEMNCAKVTTNSLVKHFIQNMVILANESESDSVLTMDYEVDSCFLMEEMLKCCEIMKISRVPICPR